MTLRRRAAAFLLLMASVGAMLVAPVAHQFVHALEHARMQQEIAAQPQHVHTDYAALSTALDGVQHLSFFCPVCSNAHRAIPSTTVVVAGIVAHEPVSDAIPALAAATSIPSRAIRAPPLAG